MPEKRKFTGYIVSGRPVTSADGRKSGINGGIAIERKCKNCSYNYEPRGCVESKGPEDTCEYFGIKQN